MDYAYWRNMYEDGATYEEIALECGSSVGTVRAGVREAGGQSRASGQRIGTRQKKRAPTDPGDWIRNVPSSGAKRQSKRRRGRPRHI